MNTLAKINLYYLIPGLVFIRLYETTLTFNLFFTIFCLFVLYSLALYLLAYSLGHLFRLNRSLRTAFINSTLYFNSGNYGISVNDLAFRHDPFAMSIQIIILTLSNLLIYSFGIFSVQATRVGKLKALMNYVKLPVTYAMLAGILFNVFHLPLPQFLHTSGSYIADALIGIALLTLGAQVVQLKFTKHLQTVYWSVITRLVLGPLLAYVIIVLTKVEGLVAQAFFIASAMPTSITTSIIAQEYDNEPEYAAQAVLFTTLFSMITVTVVIYLATILF